MSDKTVSIYQINKYLEFYYSLQNKTDADFINNLNIFYIHLSKYYIKNFNLENYKKNPFIFFINAFNNKHKKIFILHHFNKLINDNEINIIINVGDFFFKFLSEIKFTYNYIFKWSPDKANNIFSNFKNNFVDVYFKLNEEEKKDLISWYNKSTIY